MVPSTQFAWDQILNPQQKKESHQGKEMNHSLSHYFETTDSYHSAALLHTNKPSTWIQTVLGLTIIHGVATTCPGKTLLTPGFR